MNSGPFREYVVGVVAKFVELGGRTVGFLRLADSTLLSFVKEDGAFTRPIVKGVIYETSPLRRPEVGEKIAFIRVPDGEGGDKAAPWAYLDQVRASEERFHHPRKRVLQKRYRAGSENHYECEVLWAGTDPAELAAQYPKTGGDTDALRSRSGFETRTEIIFQQEDFEGGSLEIADPRPNGRFIRKRTAA